MKRPASSRMVPHGPASSKQKSAIKPIGQTRRTFLKQSGAAGIAAYAAFGAHALGADAEGWEDKHEDFEKEFEAECDTLLAVAIAKASQSYGGAENMPSPGELRTFLGWTAGQKIKAKLKQTVRWKEKAPSGYVTQTKYKKLEWEYTSGNIFEKFSSDGIHPTKEEKYGYHLTMENYSECDEFGLQDETSNPNHTIFGTDREPTAGSTASWAFSSPEDFSLPDTDYKLKPGTMAANLSEQPQRLWTDSDREGTKFNVYHASMYVIFLHRIWLELKDGRIVRVSLPAQYIGEDFGYVVDCRRGN